MTAAPASLVILAFVCACSMSTQGLSDGDVSTGEPASTGEHDVSASTGENDVPAGCVDLHPRVLSVLESNCAQCHGGVSLAQGGIGYILDVDALIANNKIVPGKPDMSRIYVRMSTPDSPMPPVDESQRPGADDIVAVHDWIERCLDPTGSCDDPTFIDNDEILTRINQDLEELPLQALPFTRYLSFAHLHNAGLCEPEIEVHRLAVAKLVNNLSQGLSIKPPVPIDELRLIYRVDISDYAWDQGGPFHLSEPSHYFPLDPFVPSDFGDLESERVYANIWEMIANQNPYAVVYMGELAQNIMTQTGSFTPLLPGDAFVDAAARAPLYYDILGIPRRSGQLRVEDGPCAGDECLETKLGLNLLADIEDERANNDDRVMRAGLHESLISDFNRVVERHQFPFANNRSLWLTYDFAGQVGSSNIGDHPLDFMFNATTLFYTLPNGLLGFMLTDGQGQRINTGFVNIIHDESQSDSLVRAGVSCMGCHSAGPQPAEDDVRWDLDMGMTGTLFSDTEKSEIRDLYPMREDFDQLLEQDIAQFSHGMNQCGVSTGKAEPVLASFLAFGTDLELRRAAAELGLTEAGLLQKLEGLSSNMMALASPGGTIQREVFAAEYARNICALDMGRTRCCAAGQLDPAC